MGYYGYYDGKFYKEGELLVPLTDRSVYFGDGVYDVVLGVSGKFYLLSEHLARFYANIAAIGLCFPYSEGRLRAIVETLAEGRHGTHMLYLQASRSSAIREHAPEMEGAHFLVTLSDAQPPSISPISLIGVRDQRYELCHIKTLNLLPNVLAAKRARDAGADEAILLFRDTVREGSHSNVSIVKGNVLLTHPTDCHILPGIMRSRLIARAKDLGMQVREIPFTEGDLLRSDGVIVTSTTKLARPADRYSGADLCEPSDVARRLVRTLHQDFLSFVRN